jgi:hypothetical protein
MSNSLPDRSTDKAALLDAWARAATAAAAHDAAVHDVALRTLAIKQREAESAFWKAQLARLPSMQEHGILKPVDADRSHFEATRAELDVRIAQEARLSSLATLTQAAVGKVRSQAALDDLLESTSHELRSYVERLDVALQSLTGRQNSQS